jgi:hypothetical protein
MIFRGKIYTYSKTPNICRNNISNGSNHLGTAFVFTFHHTDADRDAIGYVGDLKTIAPGV